MGNLYQIINAEAIAINKKHLDPKNGPLDVEGELAKIKSHVDSLKNVEMEKIKGKYEVKTAALPATLKIKIAKYRLDRFNSTDSEKYGEDNIKLNLNSLIEKHMKAAEITNDQNEQKQDDQTIKKAESESQKRVAKGKKKFEQHTEAATNLNDTANKNLKNEAPNDFLLRSRTLAQQAETDLNQFENELKDQYDKEAEKIDSKAKEIGEPLGAKDVEKFNRILDKAAKKIVYIKRKIIMKLEILKNKLIQTAKLKIMALLGL